MTSFEESVKEAFKRNPGDVISAIGFLLIPFSIILGSITSNVIFAYTFFFGIVFIVMGIGVSGRIKGRTAQDEKHKWHYDLAERKSKSTSIKILNERLARGEITKKEYRNLKKEIEGAATETE